MPSVGRARYPALRHRNFALIWSGLLVSNMGTWMQNVAQSWLIYKLTGNNPLYLGYLGLSFAIPMIILPPLGGALADRVERITLLYVTQTCALLLAAALAILTWSGQIRPAHLLITTLLGSFLLAFDNPTRQSLIPELVPRADLMNALSFNAATYNGAALIGPALAGALLNVVGAGWLFLLNAISFLAVIGALWSLRDLPQRRQATPFRQALFGGFIYVLEQRTILLLLVLSALASLFGRSYQQLLPIFADDIWRVGAGGYGALLSAGGAGALIGAFAMASARDVRAQGRVLLISGGLFCGALVGFALVPWFWLGFVLLVLVGVTSTVFTTMIATIIQLGVPGELRGRVVSLYSVTLIGLPSLGALGVAAVARALNERTQVYWARLVLALLDGLGVRTATRQLGSVAGAPRAIVSGALVLLVVLIVLAPWLYSLSTDNEASQHNDHRARTR